MKHLDESVEEATGGADALAKLASEEWEEVLVDRRLHDLDVGELVRLIHSRHPLLRVRMVDSEAKTQETGNVVTTIEESPDPSHVESAIQSASQSVNQPLEQSPDQSYGPLFPLGSNSFTKACPHSAGESSASISFPNRLPTVHDFPEIGEQVEPSPRFNPLPGMIGCGPGLTEIFRLAHLVGPRRTTVLVTGETGTGKELVAHGIHQISPRARNPFVVVNCAAIPEQLLEAELFGYARGAFTGAVQSRLGRVHCAHSGTLFLDEVGELPLSMQAKLLRFLQDGEIQRLGSSDVFRVDVRVVSATNVDLLRRVQEKQFRLDLYYRLAVFPLELPPLRERREDIPALAEHFLKALAEEADEPPKQLAASAAAVLRQHHWPGNVREMQHAIERAYILSQNEKQLRPPHFSLSGAALR